MEDKRPILCSKDKKLYEFKNRTKKDGCMDG
jgi:hypothetical protein